MKGQRGNWALTFEKKARGISREVTIKCRVDKGEGTILKEALREKGMGKGE